jgi:radical SAM superfamily enzyme YgiQ (UPF0313 family)
MRIFLASSYLGENSNEPIVFPLGLAYLASMLSDHELLGWDPSLEQDAMTKLSRILESFGPDVVCVSFRNVDSVFSSRVRSYYGPFVTMVKTIKKVAPSCKLVVGGAGFSIFAEEIMKRNPEIDYGVFSEGEYAFSSLLKNFDHPERVKNLVLRKGDEVVSTERDDSVELGLLPSPSRECFDLAKYRDHPFSIGVQSSRGCAFGCIYCLHRFLMGSRYRLRSPKKVVEEIEDLFSQYGIESFYFVDPVFNVPFDHARSICEEIKRRKLEIRWEACFRPDFLNLKFMKEAIDAGCRLFDFSPDGASNEAMQVLGKGLEVRDVEKTIQWASRIEGASVAYEFVYDLPSGNREHMLGLTRLFPKIMYRCRNKLRYLTLTKMRIYPHTPLYKIAREQGKIDADTDLIPPVHYESHSSKNIGNVLPFLLRGSSTIYTEIFKKFAMKT